MARNPLRQRSKLTRSTLRAVGGVLLVLGFLVVFPGALFIGPGLMIKKYPAGHAPLPELILLNLVQAALALALSGLGIAARKAARSAGKPSLMPSRTIFAARPGRRVLALWAAGNTIVLLGVFTSVLGFQYSVIDVDTRFRWLAYLGIGFCGAPVSLYGALVVSKARREARFPAPVLTNASWRQVVGGWCLRVASWIVRLLGSALVFLGALTVLTLVISPPKSGTDFSLGVFLYLTLSCIGSAVFRLGLAAERAAKRTFGLATTVRPGAALGRWPKARARILRIAGTTALLAGATATLCGARLALGDATEDPRPPGIGGASSPVLILINLAIAVLGAAICIAGLAIRRVAVRRFQLAPATAPLPQQRRARGWLLRVVSWCMRIGGSVTILAGILALRLVSSTSHRPVLWIILVLISISVNILGVFILKFSAIPAMKASRYLASVLTTPSDLSPGSYVLYLRPFIQDSDTAARIPQRQNQNSFNNPFQMIMQSDRAHEERLGALFAEFGPLLAVGSPGEQIPGGAGALRIYMPPYDWQDTVGELIDNARLIVLGTGPGPGTVWEYVEVLRRRHPSRLVLLVNDPIEYKRFKASSIAEAEGVLVELKHRYGDSWEAPILPDLPHHRTTSAERSFWFRAMIYFTDGWEPHMIALNLALGTGNFRLDNHRIMDSLHPMIVHLRSGTTDADTEND